MTSEYIEYIIHSECGRILTTGANASLADGAMGVALFMIWYGRKYGKGNYINEGLRIINEKCVNLSDADPLDLHKGQVGIAIGVTWLFLSGTINTPLSQILCQVDDNIFKNIITREGKIEEKHIGSLIDIGCYLAIRLSSRSFDGIDNRIYSKLLCKIINLVYPRYFRILAREVFPGGYSYLLPRFVYLLSLSFGNGFDVRLTRIIEEIQPYVLGRFPYMVSNRIALANSIYLLASNHELHSRWEKHAALLTGSIDKDDITNEFRANQMSLFNGLSWFALQLLISRRKGFILKDELYKITSEMLDGSIYANNNTKYDGIRDRNFVGLYGILGYVFVRLQLKQ